MKKILFAFSLLIALAAGAQTTLDTAPGYVKINDKFNYLAVYLRSLNIPVGCGFPVLQSGQYAGAGRIYFDSCGGKIYRYNAGWRALTDSVNLKDTAAALRALIGTGSGGLTGARNLGTSYRIFLPDSSGWKTLGTRYGTIIDSSTANTLKIGIDTSTILSGDSVYFGKTGSVGPKPAAIINIAGGTNGQVVTYLGGSHTFGLTTISAGMTVGTTAITSGTAQRVLYESSTNKLAETANFEFDGTSALNLPATGRYNIGGLSSVFVPNQTNFGKTGYLLNYSTGGSALSHSSSIQGGYNIYVGSETGDANTTGQANTGIGAQVLKICTTCSNNTFGGADAGFSHVTGDNNTAWGKGAMQNGTGSSSAVAIGREALIANAAAFNTGVGDQALFTNSSGTRNLGLGPQAGFYNATGSHNVWVGPFAGVGVTGNNNNNNTGLGYLAASGCTTCSGTISIGDSADYNITNTVRSITIGTALQNNGNNSLNIGGLIFGTGMTATGTSAAGNMGVQITTPREVLDVNGQVSIRTVNAGASTDKDSLVVMKDGRISTVRGDQTLSVNTSDVGNVGSGEDDLMTYTIPAGQLSTNNDRIEFEGVYQFTGSNSKTLKAYFGSQLLTSVGAGTAVAFITIKGTIIRTGATTQKASITMVSSSSTYQYNVDISTPAETLSGTVVIKSTGTATSDNDIVQKSFIVKFYAAP